MTSNPVRGRAMLVHAGALGDFVLSLRVVAALRHAGASEVTLLGRFMVAELARLAGVDRVIDFETGGCHALFRDDLPLPPDTAARLAGHELVVNMAAAGDSVFSRRLSHVTGARVIDLDPRPRPGLTAHITDQWLHDLAAAGLVFAGVSRPRIELPPWLIESTRSAQSGPADRTVLIHPGSGGRAKCWPVDQFIDLAKRLAASGDDVAFLVGPVERESWTPAEIAKLAAVGSVLCCETAVELAAQPAAADRYVGNDSGPTHLAAAVGTPVTAIFRQTDPRLWRPLGRHVTILGGSEWPSVDAVAATLARRLDAIPMAG